MIQISYNQTLNSFARHLRRDLTKAEAKLWYRIRQNQVLGIRFYCQSIISNMIVDFYAPEIKLAIEVDGPGHFESDQIAKDVKRDLYLRRLGIEVLRFDNRQIYCSFEAVLEEIYRVVGSFSQGKL